MDVWTRPRHAADPLPPHLASGRTGARSNRGSCPVLGQDAGQDQACYLVGCELCLSAAIKTGLYSAKDSERKMESPGYVLTAGKPMSEPGSGLL